MRLDDSYFLHPDVVSHARNVLGKMLIVNHGTVKIAAIISETEAYEGETDRASHAWNGRRTKRTETMYGKGGMAYVYLCYGMHKMMNIVTHEAGTPHAVLLRSAWVLQPGNPNPLAIQGPGRLTKTMGIQLQHNGADLMSGNEIWMEDIGITPLPEEVLRTPRIGIAYAAEHALWPYRFVWTPAPATLAETFRRLTLLNW